MNAAIALPPAAAVANVLEVRNLRTEFRLRHGTLPAVSDVSFNVGRGEVLGLVGESGSGKSVTGFSILGLVDPPGHVAGGQVIFGGADLTRATEGELRSLRGRRIAMIFQDPMMTLNPVLRIETQMVETVRAHERVSRKEAWQRARDALGLVGISSPEERLSAYPHQFSGGMRQRVAIAIAMLHRPDLIIADEPTTALDVTIQSQILAEMQTLTRVNGMAMIWISHDLAVVAGLAHRVAVMYAGRIVEIGQVDDVLDRPRHPYTKGLIGSVPSHGRHRDPLQQIPGAPPNVMQLPEGCPFRPRCSRATDICRTHPDLEEMSPAHLARCYHPVPVEGPIP